ncbi:hypothetical protein AAFF_G00441040, partial [Aldrovandia affinis]
MRGQHHDGHHREEAQSVSGDQGSPAGGARPVQAGEHAHPAQLEEEQRTQEVRPTPLLHPHHRLLGHRHL